MIKRKRWMRGWAVAAVFALTSSCATTAPTTTEPTVTTTEPQPTTTSTTSTTTTTLPPTPFADHVTVGDPIRLSPTHRVTGVAAEDVLNVRAAPSPSASIRTELAPDGVMRFTGELGTASDGGSWAKVVLPDPAAHPSVDPQPYDVIWGWVNTRFTEPTDTFAPIGETCEPGPLEPHSGDPGSSYGQIVDVTVLPFDQCSQIIITLGEADGNDNLGATLPPISVSRPFGDVVRLAIDDPADGSLQVMVPASEVFTADIEVYAVRRPGGGIWFDIHGAAEAGVQYLADQGQIVVTVEGGAVLPDRDFTLSVAHVVEGDDTMTVRGYARPFEASMRVEVVDSDGVIAEVEASGDSVWLPGPGVIGVMTTDWSEAWGWYEFTLDLSGLTAGDYFIRLLDEAVDGPDSPVLEIPVTVP